MIRLCGLNEIDKLQGFLNEKWVKNHIMGTNLPLMNFQHLSEENYNFFISIDDISSVISAVWGFIPLSQYDPELGDNNDFWGAIWKVDDDNAPPGTGLMLYFTFRNKFKPASFAGIGTSDFAHNILKKLKFTTGYLKHYYLRNPNFTNFHIAQFTDVINDNMEFRHETNQSIKLLDNLMGIDEIKHDYYPRKSINYIVNRYVKHPIYKYLLFGIFESEKLIAVWVMRKINVNDSSCLRIVDMIGQTQNVSISYNHISDIVINMNVEYVDCLNYGFDNSLFETWGFKKKGENDIIPNYFEPFIKKNNEIRFAYKANYPLYCMFKGDADQDRPNKL